MTGLDEDALRALVGTPSRLVQEKELHHVDRHARAFIAASPMAIVATADADGRCDASPRGDAAGFVRVLDDRTLFLPERKGNRRIDTLRNVAANPQVGLIFLVPGTDETVRVNGRAEVVDDPELLARCAVEGKVPQLGILVHVEEVFFHCARAFLRARLWQPETWAPREALPTLGQIISDQVPSAPDAAALDADLDESNRSLY